MIRLLNADGRRLKYTLPDLPYDYNALEPVYSADMLKVHHAKHHAAYVNNLNAALDRLPEAEAQQDIPKITQLTNAIKFNAGGHFNHSIFWANLCPARQAGGEPSWSVVRTDKARLWFVPTNAGITFRRDSGSEGQWMGMAGI